MSIQREIMRGTAWVIGARWLARSLGVISTIILARIILPKDYGLVALATLVTGLVGIFGEVGLLYFLIREPDPHRSHFDTAWSLRMIIGVSLSLVILLVAPFAGRVFSEPDVVIVIQCLALPMFLQGLQNTGVAWFRKNLDFRSDFVYLASPKFVSAAVTIGLAFVWRNYWALVVGLIAGSVASLIQSYVMHPFRPRFDLSRTREVWKFSTWTLVYQVVDFLASKAPTMIIGRLRDASAVGLFNVADDLATAPIYELAIPMSRVLVPAYSKIAQDSAQLTQVFAKVFSTMAILVFSVCTGVSLVAHDAVAVLLGARWKDAAPLVELLAPVGGLMALSQPIQPLLIALGKPKISAYLTIAQVIISVPLMAQALIMFGLPELAQARILAASIILLLTIVSIVRVAGISYRVVILSLWRPALSALAMCVAVRLAQAASPDIAVVRLAIAALAGGITYAGVLMLSWRAAGSPKTIEFDVVTLLRKAIARA